MAGEQYSYNESDEDWFATFLARVEKQSKGYNGISLTNFLTTSVCAIAAGSVVEIDGAVYHFSAETSVTGAVATGMMYILLSVTGTQASPYWSTVIFSTYDSSKQGLYDGGNRYVCECHYGTNGTEYLGKYIYPSNTRLLRRKMPLGDWDMTSTTPLSIYHELVASKICSIDVWIRGDIGSTAEDAWAPLDYGWPNIGQKPGGAFKLRTATVTQVYINREDGGYFDTVSYNATSFNRGWLYLWYEV